MAIIISKEENLSFYRALGFYETYRKERAYDTVVLMDCNGMELEIFIDGSHKCKDIELLGLRHFALKVSATIENEIERLRRMTEMTIDISPIMRDWRDGRFCFVKDPDGTVIELHE